MRRATAVRATVLALALMSPQMLACGLFKPRDVRPGGGAGVVCLTPNTPDDVVSNVLANYASSVGLDCYTAMLDTAFAFHPDDADSIAAADTVYANWTRTVESNVASLLAGNATFHKTFFDSMYATTVISPGPPRTEVRYYAYHLIIHASQAAPDTLFSGRADLTIVQGSDAQWHIVNWQDRRDTSGARTWGYLRRLYRF
ncbi:MAG: hypothetical protein E6K76_11770 [Candidatus Eisenbacteria bacterium]|uniref:SnoaL-like domain-containing protein n=1 Tax=Eiseniibacteriota bacterium TaxID=2212470 RepID=A0A538T038_UNCEI|nr:MAG: hypothetical protein E6K76_11770 [Candidatus Eisenbacteria bacterium]